MTKRKRRSAAPHSALTWKPQGSLAKGGPKPDAPTRQLFDLLRRGRWDAALRRCASRPSDAAFRVRRGFHERYDPAAGKDGAAAYRFCDRGFTPLHMTILKGAPPGLVQSVLAAHPAATCERGAGDGKTPFHLMAEIPSRVRPRLMRLFMERYPPSAADLVRIVDVPADIAETVLTFVPHPALVGDARGRTVLHHLCMGESRLCDCTKLLASSAPAALGSCDDKGWTPLHYYVLQIRRETRQFVDTFEHLADLADLGALTAIDSSGVTPLHVACASFKPAELVLAILRRAPHAAAIKGLRGIMPLQWYVISASRQAVGPLRKFLSVVEELARMAPECLKAPILGHDFTLLDFVRERFEGTVGRKLHAMLRDIAEEHANA